MIRQGFRVRRFRLFMLLFSLVTTITCLGTGNMWGAVVMALLTVWWAYELVRIHRAIVRVKSSPFYYLILMQDEFGGAS